MSEEIKEWKLVPPYPRSQWIADIDAQLVITTGNSPGGAIIAKLIEIILDTAPTPPTPETQPTVSMEPVAKVVRNEAGQVTLKWATGDVYDHLGEEFHSAEQLATLQAECQRLDAGWHEANIKALELQTKLEQVEKDKAEMLKALRIASGFCGSLSAEICPDTTAIPLREVIAKYEQPTQEVKS